VGTRPYGKGAINGKPCAVASCSPGVVGGFGANHQIRQCVVFPNMPMMQMPELYVGHVDKVVDAAGKPASDATGDLFKSFMNAFAGWIEKHGKRQGA
jgi:chromate reductase